MTESGKVGAAVQRDLPTGLPGRRLENVPPTIPAPEPDGDRTATTTAVIGRRAVGVLVGVFSMLDIAPFSNGTIVPLPTRLVVLAACAAGGTAATSARHVAATPMATVTEAPRRHAHISSRRIAASTCGWTAVPPHSSPGNVVHIAPQTPQYQGGRDSPTSSLSGSARNGSTGSHIHYPLCKRKILVN